MSRRSFPTSVSHGPVIISACLAHDRASNARANSMEEIDRCGLAWPHPGTAFRPGSGRGPRWEESVITASPSVLQIETVSTQPHPPPSAARRTSRRCRSCENQAHTIVATPSGWYAGSSHAADASRLTPPSPARPVRGLVACTDRVSVVGGQRDGHVRGDEGDPPVGDLQKPLPGAATWTRRTCGVVGDGGSQRDQRDERDPSSEARA
jgi:hypothetical protein